MPQEKQLARLGFIAAIPITAQRIKWSPGLLLRAEYLPSHVVSYLISGGMCIFVFTAALKLAQRSRSRRPLAELGQDKGHSNKKTASDYLILAAFCVLITIGTLLKRGMFWLDRTPAELVELCLVTLVLNCAIILPAIYVYGELKELYYTATKQ